MLPKHPDQYTDSELEEWVRHRVVEDKVSEGPRLDYKELKLEGQWRREAAKDISSFANETGGTIIYGISEDRQSDEVAIPKEPYGMDPIPGLEEQLENIYVDSILPHLPESRVRKVKLSKYPGKVVYVAWTPESWVGPHMVSAYKEKRYYQRGQLRAVLMEEHEVRLRYERSQRLKSTVFEFLDTQQALFTSWYRRFSQYPLVSNYVLCPQFAEPDRAQLSSAEMREWLRRNQYYELSSGLDWRPCAEGVETYTWNETEEQRLKLGETVIYKNGAITRWGETATFTTEKAQGKLLLNWWPELSRVWMFLQFGAKFFQQIAYYGPLWFRVSIFKGGLAEPLWLLTSEGPLPVYTESSILHSRENWPINLDLQLGSTRLFNEPQLVFKVIADEIYRLFGKWEAPPLGDKIWDNIPKLK